MRKQAWTPAPSLFSLFFLCAFIIGLTREGGRRAAAAVRRLFWRVPQLHPSSTSHPRPIQIVAPSPTLRPCPLPNINSLAPPPQPQPQPQPHSITPPRPLISPHLARRPCLPAVARALPLCGHRRHYAPTHPRPRLPPSSSSAPQSDSRLFSGHLVYEQYLRLSPLFHFEILSPPPRRAPTHPTPPLYSVAPPLFLFDEHRACHW